MISLEYTHITEPKTTDVHTMRVETQMYFGLPLFFLNLTIMSGGINC